MVHEPEGARAAVRIVGIIRSVLAWTWAALTLPPLTLLSILALPFVGGRMHDWSSTIWMRGVLWFSGIRVAVSGAEHVRRDAHYVIACNHQSLVDILAVLSVLQPLTPVRFMAKRSLFYVPVFGLAMWAFGHLPVDRATGRGVVGRVRRAEKSLARASFVFFPEGTRTLDGAMRPFKRGAFWLAARAGVPVLPITITGALEAFPKGQYFIYGRPVIQLQIHPAIPPVAGEGQGGALQGAAVQALESRAWKTIAAALPEKLRERSRAA